MTNPLDLAAARALIAEGCSIVDKLTHGIGVKAVTSNFLSVLERLLDGYEHALREVERFRAMESRLTKWAEHLEDSSPVGANISAELRRRMAGS